MATLLGSFLDPFSTDDDEPEDWLVLQLAVRALGALWLGVVLGVAVTHRFVQLLGRPEVDRQPDRSG